MNEQPDWDNIWGRAQDRAAITFGVLICLFLACVGGVLAMFAFKPATSALIGIGLFTCLLRITFKDWHD